MSGSLTEVFQLAYRLPERRAQVLARLRGCAARLNLAIRVCYNDYFSMTRLNFTQVLSKQDMIKYTNRAEI